MAASCCTGCCTAEQAGRKPAVIHLTQNLSKYKPIQCASFQPQSAAEFFDTCWEKAPRVFPASACADRASFFRGLMDFKAFEALTRKRETSEDEPPLQFGLDVNAARYVNGKRETPNGDVRTGRIDVLGVLSCLYCRICYNAVRILNERWESPSAGMCSDTTIPGWTTAAG